MAASYDSSFFFDVILHRNIQPYLFELKYTEEELRQREKYLRDHQAELAA